MKQITFVVLAALCATSMLWAQATSENFTLKITPEASVFKGTEGDTATGTVDCIVKLDATVGGIQGWSYGVVLVPALGTTMRITALRAGSDVMTINDGGAPGFQTLSFYSASDLTTPVAVPVQVPPLPPLFDKKTGIVNIRATDTDIVAVTQAIIVDMGATITLDATTDYELVAFTVDVSAPIGAAKAEVGRVTFSDAIGSPPVTATMVCAECGSGVPPAVMTPAVISTEPVYKALPTAFTLAIGDGSGGTNALATSLVTLNFNSDGTNADALIQGWSYGLCVKDAAKLDVVSATTDGTDTATVLNGGPPDFNTVSVYPGPGVTHAVVIDYAAQNSLTSRNGWTDLAVTYKILMSTEGDSTFVVPCNKTLGSPVIANVMVIGGSSTPASLAEGTSPIDDCVDPAVCNIAGKFNYMPGSRFVPGSANGDGRLDIADGIYLLSYLFRDGSDPKCLKAADANGDCAIDLSDAVAIIYYLLQPGAPNTPYPAPVMGVGCRLVMTSVCPLLSCGVDECL